MTTDKQQVFSDIYRANEARWDTGITPPEIMAVLAELPAGKALDLGCGTGTNVRTLLQHGWEADGVDFVELAIGMARAKLAAFPAERFGLYCGDVSQLDAIPTLRAPFDLAIDIGCGHSVPADGQPKYATGVAARLKTGASFMLYIHFPHPGHDHGLNPEDVYRLFLPYFDLVWEVRSDDTTTGTPSAWYRLARR
ncbi:MAG: class I SAM-dependent methyltransferase [Anaerolineae bacterium]|nr:class I SAM-dependent methyltransferase [Anaerolineae bacterium]